MAKIELKLILDPDIYIFFEEDTRSGIHYLFNRYNKASNNNLKSYNPKQELKHIIYLDKNNFYRYAMSQFLPTNGFKWIDPKEFNVNRYTTNS